jgi:hypothetical protein
LLPFVILGHIDEKKFLRQYKLKFNYAYKNDLTLTL